MLSAALGDALGASYGSSAELRYTDDTAMIVLAEHLLENHGEVDPLKLAWKFLEAYEAEPWRGVWARTTEDLQARRGASRAG
jgi:ADP-ribosylglycohydrolase